MNDDNQNRQGLRPIGDLLQTLTKGIKPLTKLQRRLISMPVEGEEDDSAILFQHSVLCQTSLPYRDPGDDIRLWERRNGITLLEIQAGRAYDKTVDDFINVGLPHGPKPRLVLYHLNVRPSAPNRRCSNWKTASRPSSGALSALTRAAATSAPSKTN